MSKEPIKKATKKGDPTTTTPVDAYVVIIGFEVNYPDAFNDGIMDLDVDYGHAFFYITKNDRIVISFSFGPNGGSDPNSLANKVSGSGEIGPRPGRATYPVSEATKLFRIPVTEKVAKETIKNTQETIAEINAGKLKYNVVYNDTCAATAREILEETIDDLPSGSGKVKTSKTGWQTTVPMMTNPYMWHHNFKIATIIDKKTKKKRLKYKEYILPEQDLVLKVGKADPLIEQGVATTSEAVNEPSKK